MKSLILMVLAVLRLDSLPAQNLEKVLGNYITVKNHLVNVDSKKASASAIEMISSIEELKKVSDKKELMDELIDYSKVIQKMESLEKQRTALGKQSEILWTLIQSQSSFGREYFYDYCPMKKMHWISETKAIRNPFFGNQMLSCGKVEEIIH